MWRLELKDKELQHEFELRKFEIEETGRRESVRVRDRQLSRDFATMETDFYVNKCISLIPPFSERDVDKYLCCLSSNDFKSGLQKFGLLLLQCVFTGKAQDGVCFSFT